MGYLTSGNDIVDAMGSINISGNIIPAVWYKTITRDNGRPYLLAIVILADIVYWYRPSEVRDQTTGNVLKWKKKFSDDILRQSYQYYSDLFGESKRAVKSALDRLEDMGVIKREFRTVSYGDGLISNNVMYVKLSPSVLYEITYPEKIPENTNAESEGSLSASVNGYDYDMGGSLPQNNVPPITKFCRRGCPENTQVSTNLDIGNTSVGDTLPQNFVPGLTSGSDTYTKNTAYTSPENSHQIISNPERSIKVAMPATPKEDKMDMMDEATAYIELIKQNIDYDHVMNNDMGFDKRLYQEIFEIIVDVVVGKRKTIVVGSAEYPHEVVKSRFLKITLSHVEYVIDRVTNNTGEIFNIRAYLITALYNAPTTETAYFSQLVQHDMYGGGWQEKGIV